MKTSALSLIFSSFSFELREFSISLLLLELEEGPPTFSSSLSIFFIIGVMVGVVLINNSDEQSKAEISGYINGFVEIIKSDTYKIDKIQLVKISIWENLKLVLLIWIAGSTIIGIPLIYIITGYKGFCIGYTISAIITSLGVGRRNCVFNICIIFAECNSDTSDFNA